MNTPNTRWIIKIGPAHGIKGDAKCHVALEDPSYLLEMGPLRSADGRIFEVRALRETDKGVILAFKNVTDRTMVEALRGLELFADESALPEPENDDEFYIDDLIGMDVRLQDGTPFGTVVMIYNFGAGDILEITPVEGADVMIPFRTEFVPSIDIEAGVVTIIVPNFV